MGEEEQMSVSIKKNKKNRIQIYPIEEFYSTSQAEQWVTFQICNNFCKLSIIILTIFTLSNTLYTSQCSLTFPSISCAVCLDAGLKMKT